MKGTMRKPVMTAPFTRPHPMPVAIPARAARIEDSVALKASALVTMESATTEPTLRSMPALAITTVMPIAPRLTITVCMAIVRTLIAKAVGGQRNCWSWHGASTPKRAMRRTRPRKAPRIRSTSVPPRGLDHDRLLGPLRDRTDRRREPPPHHRNPVRDAQELGQVRADEEDRLP